MKDELQDSGAMAVQMIGRPGGIRREIQSRRRSSARRASTLELWMLKNMAKDVGNMGTLAHRVMVRMEKVKRKLQTDADESDDEEDLDMMDDAHLDQLCTPVESRTSDTVDKICGVLHRFVPAFTAQLNTSAIWHIAEGLLYHYFDHGSVVCEASESTCFFFLVVRGSVHLTERTVCHLEGIADLDGGNLSKANTRVRIVRAGEWFHHFPLVTGADHYGFSARVEDSQGASIILIPKEEYNRDVKKLIVAQVTRVVELLHPTKFFASWTERAMWRLYFWLEQRSAQPDEDIITQGERATFCFIILRGRCTVLVPEMTHGAQPMATLPESRSGEEEEEKQEEKEEARSDAGTTRSREPASTMPPPRNNGMSVQPGGIIPSRRGRVVLPGMDPNNVAGMFQPRRMPSVASFDFVEKSEPDEESSSDLDESSSSEEDIDEDEREAAAAKRAADKAAAVAERAAEKAARSAEVASAKLIEKEAAADEEGKQDESWTTKWKRAKARESARIAFEKVAAEKRRAAEDAAKAAARAVEAARRIQQDAEAASYRRRQLTIQEEHGAETETLAADKPSHPVRGVTLRDFGWHKPPQMDARRQIVRKDSTGGGYSGGASVMRARSGSTAATGRDDLRVIVTLQPGSIVGEIALFQEGARRMATVRASEHVDLLVLDKQSFLQLDKATLTNIYEDARYSAACAKKASDRTREDLRVLQQQTAALTLFSNLEEALHLELCRVMKYRKVGEGVILVRKGMPVDHLLVIISGSVACFVTDPTRVKDLSRQHSFNVATAGMAGSRQVSFNVSTIGQAAAGRRRETNLANLFVGLKETETLKAGQAIGEEELLEDDATHKITAVAQEPVEVMEIGRDDFDRVLKLDRASARGKLIDFVSKLDCMRGVNASAVIGVVNASSRRIYKLNDMCLGYPPSPTLGAASYSPDHVYLLYSGEAKLLGAVQPKIASSKRPAYNHSKDKNAGLLAKNHPPMTGMVEKHVGPHLTAATLGPGEIIVDSLLLSTNARWCLQPASDKIEIIIFPRKKWSETLRDKALQELKDVSARKQEFFDQQLKSAISVRFSAPMRSSALKLRPASSAVGTLLNLPPGCGHGVVVPPPPRAALSRQGRKGGITMSDLTETLPSTFGRHGGHPNRESLTRPWYEELGLR